jgi:hypothetical protein
MIPTQNNHNSDIFGDHRITFDQKINCVDHAVMGHMLKTGKKPLKIQEVGKYS